MRSDAFFAVDVGASWIKSALVVDGTPHDVSREPVVRELDGLVAQVARLVREAGAPGWGVCVAGLVDAERGVLRYSANLGLEDAPLAELLGIEAPAPSVFANDLDAAAIGEAQGGTLALLQVGSGIAGRFVVAGHVVPSASGHSGEVGHLRFRDDGLLCSCGHRGCAEAYGGWSGIARRYANDRAEPPAAPALPESVVADAFDAVGFAAAALVAAYDPGTLRVGGGLAAAWSDALVDAVRTGLSERVVPDVAAATTVEPARKGDASALVGLQALAARNAR